MSRYRIYGRASNGVEAAVNSILYSITIATAPLWVPVAVVWIGYMGWQEWRGQKPAPATPPAVSKELCQSLLNVAWETADAAVKQRALADFKALDCGAKR